MPCKKKSPTGAFFVINASTSTLFFRLVSTFTLEKGKACHNQKNHKSQLCAQVNVCFQSSIIQEQKVHRCIKSVGHQKSGFVKVIESDWWWEFKGRTGNVQALTCWLSDGERQTQSLPICLREIGHRNQIIWSIDTVFEQLKCDAILYVCFNFVLKNVVIGCCRYQYIVKKHFDGTLKTCGNQKRFVKNQKSAE